MAEGGEEFGGGIDGYREYIRFADDLVNQLMLRISPDYIFYIDPSTLDDFVAIRFNETIRRAIHIIGSIIEPICGTILFEMYDRIEMNSYSFLNFVEGLEIRNFSAGFNGRSLLIHCTTISCLAGIFFNYGETATPDLAKFHIANVLQERMPLDEWNTVLHAAEVFLNDLGNRY